MCDERTSPMDLLRFVLIRIAMRRDHKDTGKSQNDCHDFLRKRLPVRRNAYKYNDQCRANCTLSHNDRLSPSLHGPAFRPLDCLKVRILTQHNASKRIDQKIYRHLYFSRPKVSFFASWPGKTPAAKVLTQTAAPAPARSPSFPLSETDTVRTRPKAPRRLLRPAPLRYRLQCGYFIFSTEMSSSLPCNIYSPAAPLIAFRN